MKSAAVTAAIAIVLATSVIASVAAQTTPPRDTGNMAYPTPLPQGNVGTTPIRPPGDTGSMAYPSSGGNIGTSTAPVRGADTSSAGYQTPLPQGNVGTTVVK